MRMYLRLLLTQFQEPSLKYYKGFKKFWLKNGKKFMENTT